MRKASITIAAKAFFIIKKKPKTIIPDPGLYEYNTLLGVNLRIQKISGVLRRGKTGLSKIDYFQPENEIIRKYGVCRRIFLKQKCFEKTKFFYLCTRCSGKQN